MTGTLPALTWLNFFARVIASQYFPYPQGKHGGRRENGSVSAADAEMTGLIQWGQYSRA